MSTASTVDAIGLSAAVEGDIDEVVLRRIVEAAGGSVGAVYGKRGKSHLDERLPGYNNAARFYPWVVLRDLNHDAPCAPDLRRTLLPAPAALMCLRIAVRGVEAWLLADAQRVADFLRVPASRVPPSPEAADDPKRVIVDLAARSRNRQIRRALVPGAGSHRSVGPEYTSRMIEFVLSHWRPDVAERSSPSLRRSRRSIAAVVAAQGRGVPASPSTP